MTGREFKIERRKRGFSQESLAETMKISVRTVNRYESKPDDEVPIPDPVIQCFFHHCLKEKKS